MQPAAGNDEENPFRGFGLRVDDCAQTHRDEEKAMFAYRSSRRAIWRAVGGGITWVVLASAAVHCCDAKENAAKPKKLVLFDGKTLNGWKKTNFGGEGEVKVENGAIVMEFGSSLTGITSTRKDLPRTNYELSYEAMRRSGYDFFAAATFPVGKSYATFVNGGWGGSVTGISSLDGFDASENETSAFFDYKDKRWYKFRIRVTDERIQCFIDDKKVVDVKHKGREVDTRIEVDLSKPLGFAAWETTGAVRNIQIRMLTPREVAEINKEKE